jgi:ACS family pantothenate transporter-like MFS transporter
MPRFAQAGAHNTGTMYALRFLIGLFESAFFPVGAYRFRFGHLPSLIPQACSCL